MRLEFAVNPLDVARASGQLLASLGPRADVATHWLLIDCALLERTLLHSTLKKLGWAQHNTLADSALSEFGDAAPVLIALPAEPTALRQGMERIFSVGPNAPAFSWLSTSAEPAAVCQRLADIAKPKVDLHMSVYCRFADTRVLPALWAALDTPQRAGVSQVISTWQCFDRMGGLLQMPTLAAPANTGTAAAPWPQPFTLSEAQFALILDASEADAMFSLMLDKTPEVVPADHRGEFHQRLVGFLATATALSVNQPADRVQFVMLSLTCGERFHTHPPLQATWAAIRNGTARLSTAMASWSEALWAELAQYGGVKVRGLQ